jgi:hypothetical protein
MDDEPDFLVEIDEESDSIDPERLEPDGDRFPSARDASWTVVDRGEGPRLVGSDPADRSKGAGDGRSSTIQRFSLLGLLLTMGGAVLAVRGPLLVGPVLDALSVEVANAEQWVRLSGEAAVALGLVCFAVVAYAALRS